MSNPACSDEEFIALFSKHGPTELAKVLGVTMRNIYRRRAILEAKFDTPLVSPDSTQRRTRFETCYPSRLPVEVGSGVVIIGSDAHYWPERISTAHRAMVKLEKELQPKVVFLNGDGFDGAKISRHPPIGWSHKPTVKEELDAVLARTDELRAAAPKARHIWTLGNHDMRYENALAQKSPDFGGVQGFSLKDKFPEWEFCISAWVDKTAVVKHRFKGGVHATHNNALYAGMSMFTGHLHSLKVTPFSDYTGTRFGGDSGTLDDPYGPQFEYGEDNPMNHRSGLLVLTFHNGKLLWPEICRVLEDGVVDFRGRVLAV